MSIRIVCRGLYGLVGVVFLAAGTAVLMLGTGLLPGGVREIILKFGHEDPRTLHFLQEFACMMVLVGLISLWFARRFEQSRAFHWSMTLFWGLFGFVHWFDINGQFHSGLGQLINTAPFALFALLGVLRSRAA